MIITAVGFDEFRKRKVNGGLIGKPALHRKAHQLARAVEIELLHDFAAMGIYGIDTQVQLRRNFFVSFTFSNQL